MRFLRHYWDGMLFDLLQGEYRTEGMVFQVPRYQIRVPHRARFRYDSHERDERELVKQFLPADSTVLELGACLGVVSCVINRKLSDPHRHIAVEPNPDLLQALQRNRETNACQFIVEQALVSRRSDGTFYLSDCFVMSSENVPSARRIRVPVKTVEELERKYGLEIDSVFMDIQGGELGFLEENRNLLTRIRCVIAELHPHILGEHDVERCRSMLLEAGLKNVERRGLVEVWLRG